MTSVSRDLPKTSETANQSTDLTAEEVRVLAKAVGVDLPEAYIADVMHWLNALRERLGEIQVPGLDHVEAVPIIPSIGPIE